MTLLLLATLMAAAAGFLVVQPILARRGAMLRDVAAGRALDVEARKRVLLTELKDVEYDYLGGKLDEADYRMIRERISREALAAIHAAEALAAPATGHAEDGEAAGGAVAHDCGYANPSDSRFCAGCGARLA